jgi:hypothetical protein
MLYATGDEAGLTYELMRSSLLIRCCPGFQPFLMETWEYLPAGGMVVWGVPESHA